METFTFLKNDYPELYLLCSDVAKYINTDNSISMLKARQAIEYIVKYLGAETDDLFVNINNLEDKNIASSRIIDLFHLIRKKANKSVHNEINSDTEGVLDALIEICVWLAVGRDRKSISIIKFTDKEKFFQKKYGKIDAETIEEELEEVDTINPLEVVGNFSDEDIETTDVLEQDVFETYEEYCERIESMPAIKIGYAFLDSSQIDDYCEIAFPLFHVSKHPKIEAASVAAFYASDIGGKNIDGIIKAKLKIYEGKIYYDYDSVTLQDDDNEIELFPISWEKYGYETEEQFDERIKRLPLLPVAIAKPIRKEYNLQKQILPFETISLSYVSNYFMKRRIVCSVDRDNAKTLCLMKSPFKVYAHFKDLQTTEYLLIFNQEGDSVLFVKGERTTIKDLAESKYELYYDLAQRGNTNAQCNLGRCYEYGYGVNENEQEAFEWYKIAAENGNAEAQFKLGRCYEYEECGVDENEQEEFEWFKRAAKQGHAQAQYELGFCYEYGKGTKIDEEKAFEWFKRAAENGYYEAQYQLIDRYKNGIGTGIDNQKASEWEKKFADIVLSNAVLENDETAWIMNVARRGNAKAQYTLAELYFESSDYDNSLYKEALKWYKIAADQGHAEAEYSLAFLYERGYGIEEDEQKAFEWLTKAAENGFSKAQYELAELYENGKGIVKDKQKAFELYVKAAERRYWLAEEKLTDLSCWEGGTEFDKQKAFDLCKDDAEKGIQDKQYIISICYSKGLGTEKDDFKAFEWLTKAAENGYKDAQLELAICYEEGQGVAKDEHRAFMWYKQAAEQGNATAKYEIAERYELGIGTRKNKEKALEWYLKAAEHGNIDAKNKAMDLSRYDPSTEANIFNKMGVDYLAGKNRKPQDKEMAIYCFKRAIELGSKKAEDNLRKAAGLGKLNEKQGRSANQILIEKYKVEMVKFVNDYNKQLFLTSSDVTLTVLPEDKKRLSKNNFDSWNEIKGVENICLIETRGTFSYQAKPLNLDDGNENEKNYYLVAPNRLTHNFTRKTVVEDAYLAFFCFTNNSVSERGARGRVVKPAIFQKVNGFYKLISKGEIELL